MNPNPQWIGEQSETAMNRMIWPIPSIHEHNWRKREGWEKRRAQFQRWWETHLHLEIGNLCCAPPTLMWNRVIFKMEALLEVEGNPNLNTWLFLCHYNYTTWNCVVLLSGLITHIYPFTSHKFVLLNTKFWI